MIIVLNGASSSGKTALARALQQRWDGPLLHLGTDTALGMLPQAYVGMKHSAREGIQFLESGDDRSPQVRVRSGPIGDKLLASLARVARTLADDGHDLVLDLVWFDPAHVPSYARALRGVRTYLIGVLCDLATLEARELARGDRFQSLGRSQLDTVHEFRHYYDLEADTTTTAPTELAGAVLDYVRDHPAPDSMAQLHSALGGTDEP